MTLKTKMFVSGDSIKLGSYRRGNCSGDENKLQEDIQSVFILSYTTTKSNCCGMSHKKRLYIDVGYRLYFRLP
jgi:hypothetical protein